MAVSESNMAEFKMSDIIKLSENEWVWVRLNYFESEFCAKWLNPRWQNSRWLPSLSWVRMHEWSFFCANGWIQDGRLQDGCHHQVESEWTSELFFVQNGWIQDSRFQDGCHHQFEWECMSEVFLCKWLNPRWQNSRWLPSSSWVRMNEFESEWIRLSQSFVQHDWIQDGRIQDGCHHLVSWIELVWVRVRVEGECFWVNLREDNKVSESNMAVSESNMAELRMAANHGRIQDGCHHQVESESWFQVWVRVFLCKMAESKMAEFKMAAIIKLSENAMKFFLCK